MNSIDIKRSTIKVNNNKEEMSALHLVTKPGYLVALRATEEDRFSILYKRLFPEIMNFIHLQSGKAHQEAKDIAQDIFLILWRRRDELLKIPASELKFYLFVMVKNRLINEGKKTIIRRRIWRQIGQEPSTHAYTAHHELYDRRAEWWLNAAIEALPPKRQTAYLLREHYGLKVYEIVSRMGISQSGACFLLQKARRQIRSFLDCQII